MPGLTHCGRDQRSWKQQLRTRPCRTIGLRRIHFSVQSSSHPSHAQVTPDSLRSLELALYEDTAFLASLGVMDYSLLVGRC